MEQLYEDLITLAFEAGYFTGRTFLTKADEVRGRTRFLSAFKALIKVWDEAVYDGGNIDSGERVAFVLNNPDTFIGEDARLAVREMFERILE